MDFIDKFIGFLFVCLIISLIFFTHFALGIGKSPKTPVYVVSYEGTGGLMGYITILNRPDVSSAIDKAIEYNKGREIVITNIYSETK